VGFRQQGLGQSPGRKRISMHLRFSKRTSWQHLSASHNISYDAKCVIAPLGLDAPGNSQGERDLTYKSSGVEWSEAMSGLGVTCKEGAAPSADKICRIFNKKCRVLCILCCKNYLWPETGTGGIYRGL